MNSSRYSSTSTGGIGQVCFLPHRKQGRFESFLNRCAASSNTSQHVFNEFEL